MIIDLIGWLFLGFLCLGLFVVGPWFIFALFWTAEKDYWPWPAYLINKDLDRPVPKSYGSEVYCTRCGKRMMLKKEISDKSYDPYTGMPTYHVTERVSCPSNHWRVEEKKIVREYDVVDGKKKKPVFDDNKEDNLFSRYEERDLARGMADMVVRTADEIANFLTLDLQEK